jgi:hypothetical protein
MTRYVHVNASRVCFAFEVPGTWEPGRQQGALRRVDGKGIVGVMLLPIRELGGGSPEDAIREAAERGSEGYERYAKDKSPPPWTLEPYPRIPGAWTWSVPRRFAVEDRPGAIATIAPRWFVPVGDEWIAVFTVGVPQDADPEAFVDAVIRSLSTSREPRCYEAALRTLGAVR